MKRLIAIVGPTAVGKSSLAVSLALEFGGEIVNADSRQVYRFMDIGSAKAGPEERAKVPHHLIDIVSPDEDFSLAHYQKAALGCIEDIQDRGKLPLLTGGSGMYVWSVLEGWYLLPVPPDHELRQQLQERADREGPDVLYRELEALVPERARAIDPRNVRRVIRALEIGVKGRANSKREPLPFPVFIVGLTADRAELYRRVDERVDGMIDRGLVDEVKALEGKGYYFDLPSMSGIGYREIGLYLQGEMSLPEAVLKIKQNTHRLCRHQYAWFRLNDTRIHWFDVGGNVEGPVFDLVRGFVNSS